MSEEDLEIVFTEENDNSVAEKPEKIKGPEFEPVITDSKNADAVLRENGISYEGEIQLKQIGFCKIEAQQDCLTGSFCIPRLLDIQGSRYRIQFFITRDKVVLVDPKVPSFYTKDYVGAGISISS